MEGIQTIQALKAVQSSLPAQTTIPSDELVMLYAADGTPIAKIARDDLVKAVASVMASNSQTTFSKLLGVQANGTPMGIGASDLASVLGAFYNQGIVQDPNLNDYTSTQLVIYGTSGTVQPSQMNTPTGANGQCFVLGNGGNFCIQIVNDQGNGVYIRSKSDRREWSQWTLIAGVS